MSELNVFVSVGGIVLSILISGMTYYHVVDSNNSKEIVTRAIERGNDPVSAACAANISTRDGAVRATCEKLAIIKGSK